MKSLISLLILSGNDSVGLFTLFGRGSSARFLTKKLTVET